MENATQPVHQTNIGVRPPKLNIIKADDVKPKPPIKLKVLKPEDVKPNTSMKLKILKPADVKPADTKSVDTKSADVKLADVKPNKNYDVDNTVEIPIVDELDVERSMYLMFDGTFKSPKDLVVGDRLMGVDSLPCTITSVAPIVEKNYLIRPTKGDSFLIGESETLALTYSLGKNISWREDKQCYCLKWFSVDDKKQTSKHFTLKTYKTKELALSTAESEKLALISDNNFTMKLKDYVKQGKAYRSRCMLYKVELNFTNEKFEIDPYIIGFWLGDGSASCTSVTTIDPEIIEFLTDYFSDMNLSLKPNKITYRITSNDNKRSYPGKNKFLNFLKEKNLLNNKHIPTEFLLSSRKDRLRLLAGLLDSDGSLIDNCYDFIQKREHLLDQTIFLARSLGFSAYKKPCNKVCTNSSKGRVAGTYYRCFICGEGSEEIPVLLARKTASKRQQIKRVQVTGINLQDVGERQNYRIVTDRPLFLMADLTVRHRYEE